MVRTEPWGRQCDDAISLEGLLLLGLGRSLRERSSSTVPVVGFLSGSSRDDPVVPVFLERLKEEGYVEGQNVTLEYRFANGKYDRLPAFATDLVTRKVTAIFATGGSGAGRAAKAGDCDYSCRICERRRSDQIRTCVQYQ
jgi:hypothetical protein